MAQEHLAGAYDPLGLMVAACHDTGRNHGTPGADAPDVEAQPMFRNSV